MTITTSYEGLFVDGKWAPAGGGYEPVINPATEESIGSAPVGDEQDCARAIDAARRAFDDGPWPHMAPKVRAQHLDRLAGALASRRAELVDLVIAETGAPRALAEGLHVDTSLAHLAFFAESALWPRETSLPMDLTAKPGGGMLLGGQVQVREPYGVVAAITPFNFPLFINLAKVAPALAMGNTVVLKPSPFTPFEALLLAAAAEEADFPPGVFNVVTGGNDVGLRLTVDPAVDMISFTGSDAVGARISEQAAPTLKKVVLELGGKSALIVREDADLEAAAAFAVGQYTLQAGQGCSLCTRHLVHEAVREEFLERVVALSRSLVLGDPADSSVAMGPLIRDAQRSRVEAYVAGATEEGGEVATGGGRPSQLERGYFYEPTVLVGLDNSARICQEEVFGPVAVVLGFSSDAEAVSIANDSPFGLSGAIYSKDSGTAYEMALRLRTGQVAINGGSGRMNSWAPFGGYKRSGIVREYGVEGVNEFTQVKSVLFNAG
jgi:aldehyde dehydrogenase (NAD+)